MTHYLNEIDLNVPIFDLFYDFLVYTGFIELSIFGMKHFKCMVILRLFPYK